MYCLTPNLSHVFQELLSVYLFVLGNIEFVLTMLGLCCSLEFARTSGLQSDRKSTRLNSSHHSISYAVFCLKKKKTNTNDTEQQYKDKILRVCNVIIDGE